MIKKHLPHVSYAVYKYDRRGARHSQGSFEILWQGGGKRRYQERASEFHFNLIHPLAKGAPIPQEPAGMRIARGTADACPRCKFTAEVVLCLLQTFGVSYQSPANASNRGTKEGDR